MKIHTLVLFLIILLAAFLRISKLGENPPSLYWDEASLGYNAFSILTTGHDEHGEKFPITRFVAFGDYKPPGYVYAIVPFMAIFGVKEYVIRFPSALAGVFMVVLTYFLASKVTKDKNVGLTSAALLAVSPWSLQLSRAGFEAHLAAFFNLAAIYTFLSAFKKRWLFLVSILFFVLAFYTFNANRILSPLFILFLCLIYYKEVWLSKKWIIVALIFGIVLLWPNISYFKTRESRLRFHEVSIFTDLDVVKTANSRIERTGRTWFAKIIHNRRVYFAREFLSHYFDHFKAEFLFISGDQNPRLSTQDIGELYFFELPFLLIGSIMLLRRRTRTTAILVGWILLSPIPAGVARETPHMLRTASILPSIQIITSIGLVTSWYWLRTKRSWLIYTSLTLFLFITLGNIFYYFHNYWVHYPRDWSGEWQYGYKQMVEKVRLLENNYDKIYITKNFGRPYIFFLLFNQVDPFAYLKDRNADRDWYGLWNVYGFGKYDFQNSPQVADEKDLIVGVQGTFNSRGNKLDEVRDLKGKTVFEIGEP